MRNAVREAGVVLLEPIMSLEVRVPEQYLGDVMNDLNSRRVEIEDVAVQGYMRVIGGRAPLAEMFGYATTLRSLSQGRASHTMEPLEYRAMPKQMSRSILELNQAVLA